jgi:hypothetical protein
MKKFLKQLCYDQVEKCKSLRCERDTDGSCSPYCDIGKGGIQIDYYCSEADFCIYSFLPKWIINIYAYFYGLKLEKQYREAEKNGEV